MITTPLLLHSIIIFFFFFSFPLFTVSALNPDGITLISFKHSLISHNPSSSSSSFLQNWNQSDPTPCSWSGVTCAPHNGPVIALSLPNSHLFGSIPNSLSRLQHLRLLDLSNNSLNGTFPLTILNCSNLQTLQLSSNFISGDLPNEITSMQSLQLLNLSNNYFSGGIPGGFDFVNVLDLSSNSFNGALPLEFGGGNLNYLNLSNNKISGSVLPKFAENIPANAVVDLSFNNFTGEIPFKLSAQKTEYFAGNLDLCGKPLPKTCTVPSLHSFPPNISSDSSTTAAIAAIPKTVRESANKSGGKINSWKIVAIAVGDIAGMAILVVIYLHTYQFLKKRKNQNRKEFKLDESRGCFGGGTEEETSETETLSESVVKDEEENNNNNNKCLVMVDGETELETETLLKASAYVLGSSGGSIVYKAVVGGGGGVFAVRRLAECGVEKMKDFEKVVRGVGKLRHRNLVKVRGFYWGQEEKLVIYDYVSNGSLATAAYEKVGSSCHLSFKVRLKIAKGIAKGLAYIHEKKHVHGNLKPNNVLLTSEMDPVISDFGLEWLISGKTNYAINKSTQNFGSKRSTSSHEDTIISRDHHLHPTSSLHGCVSPYQAPESVKTLIPNPKWDVYSFGIILLELFMGKVFSYKELALWNKDSSIIDMETKILTITDQFITTMDMHGKKDSFLTCFKLGFSCASLAPHKRPSMKETLQALEKIPCPS